jgi:uncharacterized protein YecE (DUF72 family)
MKNPSPRELEILSRRFSPVFSAPDHPILAWKDRLRELAARGVWLGTSSWKYPGWLGQIYDEQNYLTRGKFSEAAFERSCLAEYASVFPTVCVDAGFYRFPAAGFIASLDALTPPDFRFAFKVTDEITIRRFPNLPRHGPKAGHVNSSFLDPALYTDAFLGALTPLGEKTGLLILEFTRFQPGDFARGRDFLDALDRFFSALPAGYQHAVELRNPSLLRKEYFELLERHGVGHVYNQWQRMPPIGEQWRQFPPDLARAPAGARLLLKSGRAYQEAVDAFSPYERVREPLPEVRATAAGMIRAALAAKDGKPLSIYVNNRLEGNALHTLAAILEASTEGGTVPG